MTLTDYHIHIVAHGEYSFNREILGSYIETARKMGLTEIGFLEHDEFVDQIDYELLADMKRENPDIGIKAGLEIDYFPGSENRIRNLINNNYLDYAMGSIHYINQWGFDRVEQRHIFEERELFEIYSDYYNLVAQAANSKLFDIIAHFDLIKLWGHSLDSAEINKILDSTLECIKKNDLVIEINSSGLRKPVKEQYPSRKIVEKMFNLDIPIVLGSDAHHIDQIAMELDYVAKLARSAGYRYLASFTKRSRSFVAL